MRQLKVADKGAQALHVQALLQGGCEEHRIQEVWLMFMDRFADAINKIKTNERIGRMECTLYSTKLLRAVLEVMKRESYIKDYGEFTEKRIKYVKVILSNKINSIGVIKPRYAVQNESIQKYETRYIPSKDFGVLILTTPQGIITNKEARGKKIGGRLLAYVY
jgi:small subunit ribosomal protein S8